MTLNTQSIERIQPLNAEESCLWQIALNWREPHDLQLPPNLDWNKLVALAIHNKMTVLLDNVLRELAVELPSGAAEQLQEGVARSAEKATSLTQVLDDYMTLAAEANVPTIPLKGLWVSERIYRDPRMRPGHDLDLLVRNRDVQRCVSLCEQLTFDRYWPGLLPDSYYQRHHLHLELSLPDCWTWVEIHWAFDHPRTLLTIDYDGMFDRATRADLLGTTIWEPNWVDALLSLSVHLVKHSIFLPATLNHPKLRDMLLADGRLMHLLDVAEAIKQYGDEIDWALLIKVSKAAGADAIMSSVLQACANLLDAPVPDWVIAQMPMPPMSPRMKGLLTAVGEQLIGGVDSRFWQFMVEPNWKFVFRPIRLLDYFSYLAPTDDYLQRRYRSSAVGTRLFHSARALGEFVQLGIETIYQSIAVKLRPLTPDIELPLDSKCREC